jgi:hypothetical protein
MFLDQLQTNFSDHSDGEFIVMQRQFATMLRSNPLSNSLPEHVPGPQRHLEYADQLTKEYDAFGKHGGKLPTRAEAEEAIKVTATYFCIVAWATKDPSMLENLGLEQKTRVYTKLPDAVPAPPGSILLKNEGKKVWITIPGMPRKGHIEVQINEVDPTNESAWRLFETLFNSRSEIKGLARVKEYWFRARFHTAAGVSEWSAVVSHVVV